MNPVRYFLNVLKWLDIGLNVVGLVSARIETFSRRSGRARHDGKRWGCIVCALLNPPARLFFRQSDHCESARMQGEIY